MAMRRAVFVHPVRFAAVSSRPLSAAVRSQRCAAAAAHASKGDGYLVVRRSLCAKGGPEQPKPPAGEELSDETQLAPLTGAQKVQVGVNLTAWAAGIGLAIGKGARCAYYIVCELFPTRLSPNSVFDNAFDVVRDHPEVQRVYGEPIKGYGRDHGSRREGRRNFIENTPYDEASDGSKRLRVRFNIKGPYGSGFVFAEVSNKRKGFVYVMVQDKRTGRVITLEDNRLAMNATGGARSDAERDALQNLLGSKGY